MGLPENYRYSVHMKKGYKILNMLFAIVAVVMAVVAIIMAMEEKAKKPFWFSERWWLEKS